MALSTLPLSYCTNVHPGRTIDDVAAGLANFTVPIRDNLNEPLAAGLWLARSVVTELLKSPDRMRSFTQALTRHELTCHTLNAFPFGDFHSERVKENVYLPDWADESRLQYTQDCARVLAQMLPDGVEGSISTVPLGFKLFEHPSDFMERAARQLMTLATFLQEIEQRTGRVIRLAIEPEPFCIIETTHEAIEFFGLLWKAADASGVIEPMRRHIGLCYDVCHQSVEFEDVEDSIRAIETAGIRINKIHITSAIELRNPADNIEGRRALAAYVEPRYLHQTIARTKSGEILRRPDLIDSDVLTDLMDDFMQAATWRIHFHVPVDAEQLGPLDTTRTDLKRALRAVARLNYAPHLEVETYTWEVLPGDTKPNIVDGMTRELNATRALLNALA